MTDIVDQQTRSRMMARIPARNTRPELLVRSGLHRRGLRFRLRGGDLPCRPDLVLPRYQVAILVHGCYWHRHADCTLAYTPRSRVEFWQTKFEDNLVRDLGDRYALRAVGWRVAVVWECGLRDRRRREPVLSRLADWIRTTDDWYREFPAEPVRRRSDRAAPSRP